MKTIEQFVSLGVSAAIYNNDDIVEQLLVEKGATANKHYQDEDGQWKDK